MAKQWPGSQSEGKNQRGYVLPSAELIRNWWTEISVCELTGIDDDGTELLAKIVEVVGSELSVEDRNVAIHSLMAGCVDEKYREIFEDATRKLIEGLLELSKAVPGERTCFKLVGAIGDNIIVATPIM